MCPVCCLPGDRAPGARHVHVRLFITYISPLQCHRDSPRVTYHCCGPASRQVSDKNLCRCFGPPVCRFPPDHLITVSHRKQLSANSLPSARRKLIRPKNDGNRVTASRDAKGTKAPSFLCDAHPLSHSRGNPAQSSAHGDHGAPLLRPLVAMPRGVRQGGGTGDVLERHA